MVKDKFRLIFVFVFIFIFNPYSCGKKQENKDSKIGHLKIVKGICDLGVIKNDTILNNFFIVQNTSNITVYYSKIYSDCGCTKIEKGKDSIMAGKIDTINFSLDTKIIQRGQAVENTVRIVSNTKPEVSKLIVKLEKSI